MISEFAGFAVRATLCDIVNGKFKITVSLTHEGYTSVTFFDKIKSKCHTLDVTEYNPRLLRPECRATPNGVALPPRVDTPQNAHFNGFVSGFCQEALRFNLCEHTIGNLIQSIFRTDCFTVLLAFSKTTFLKWHACDWR